MAQIVLGIPMHIHDIPEMRNIKNRVIVWFTYSINLRGKKTLSSLGCKRTSKAKFSGSLGGELSPRKLLHSRSASLFVIIPHLRDDIGIAPARRNISSYEEEIEY